MALVQLKWRSLRIGKIGISYASQSDYIITSVVCSLSDGWQDGPMRLLLVFEQLDVRSWTDSKFSIEPPTSVITPPVYTT
jgi:hypothetical protein